MRILSEWFYSDNTSHKLQHKGDIESYDKVMGGHPDYPKIWWYNLVLTVKQKNKQYFDRYYEART